MNVNTLQLRLHLNICLRCHTLPVQSSSWEMRGERALPCCLHGDEQPEVVQMTIAIPVSLLNDKAYSKVALRLAMER
jgi:hypothetical protein